MKKIKITIKESKKAKNEVIRKVGEKKWCLYSKKKGKDGERRRLGCYSSRKAAEKREKQVNYFKNIDELYALPPKSPSDPESLVAKE